MKTITLTAPEGYEFTGEFREPETGEFALCMDESPRKGEAYQSLLAEPRYILKKIEPKLRLSDLKPGETFRLHEGRDTFIMLRKHSEDDTSKKFVFVGVSKYHDSHGYCLYQRNDNPEVVRA